MNKNVYSIVLTDNVIRAVDAEAYRLGTNRSNLINQILAEHLSCVTPEMRMREIFDSAEMLLHRELLLMQQNSPSVLMLRTALQYKYRPTVNYRVELEREPDMYMGRLKVQIRTQNTLLTEYFNAFFSGIAHVEEKIYADKGIDGYNASLSTGCFTRVLFNDSRYTNEEKGGIIGEYLNILNGVVREFFADPKELRYSINIYNAVFSAFVEKHII